MVRQSSYRMWDVCCYLPSRTLSFSNQYLKNRDLGVPQGWKECGLVSLTDLPALLKSQCASSPARSEHKANVDKQMSVYRQRRRSEDIDKGEQRSVQ